MLMELGRGGELFSLMQREKSLSEDSSRFYAASVVSIFGHVHAKRVVYRDLKPENLLLDEYTTPPIHRFLRTDERGTTPVRLYVPRSLMVLRLLEDVMAGADSCDSSTLDSPSSLPRASARGRSAARLITCRPRSSASPVTRA